MKKSFFIFTLLFLVSMQATAQKQQPHPIVLALYQGFQSGELHRWDNIVHPDVLTNSSASFGNKGIIALKTWAGAFLKAFTPRIDMVDFINAIDEQGNGRAVLTVNLNWKHTQAFFDVLQPTGRTGTSIENLILTVKNHKITRIEVADTTLDLVIYMHENGWVFPQNIKPVPVITGIERPVEQAEIRLQ